MLFITFIYLSASFQNKQPNLQMSGSTVNTPIANTTVSAKSIIVERLCLVFGKSHEEVVQAIQSEMTAMEQEFQSWKLQLGERGDDNKKTESKPKKAAAKPRAKKADADVASSAVVTDGVEGAESAVDDVSASTAVAESKPKKAPAKPRAKKADAPATAATESAVVEEGTTTEAAEPKAKKAPAKPRAKKADAAAPLNVSAEEAAVIADEAAEPKANKAPAKPRAKKADAAAPLNVSAEEAAVIADEAAEPKAKKAPAKPRAKKAADASSESASPSTKEPKAKKNAAAKPRSKKAAEVVVSAAPVVVEAEIDAKHEETTEDQFEEVEVEVVEFEFEGVQYLRGKADNKLYDPESSDVIGVWNEQSGQIDECSEEDDE